MSEKIIFHFEGALADHHRMNFYESARFQYAAARLMVKLAQFRQSGKFTQKITNKSNFDVQLTGHKDGSFNINIEDSTPASSDEEFLKIPLSDLVAYVSERIVGKIDQSDLAEQSFGADDTGEATASKPLASLDRLVESVLADESNLTQLPPKAQELVKRRVAEIYRDRRLEENQSAISRIDPAREQKLIAMSAPLLSEMAIVLRKSANTLEVTSSTGDQSRSVLFLDRKMAEEIEFAIVDKEITPLIGDIAQFNKENGWGKLRLEGGKIFNFSIPSDVLPRLKQPLLQSMQRDKVFVQTYYVKDRSGDIIRLIIVGILPMPPA